MVFRLILVLVLSWGLITQGLADNVTSSQVADQTAVEVTA